MDSLLNTPTHSDEQPLLSKVAPDAADVTRGMSRRREPTWRELAALQESLCCKEEQLLAVHQQMAADTKQQPGRETREQLLVLRWRCLLEERKQLTALITLAAGGGANDFEPGETPMRDVTCSVITHQLDAPCLSCCFQR